jgi:hypothetical protein
VEFGLAEEGEGSLNAMMANAHNYPQGPGWSPDCGGFNFWVRGDKMFCDDGTIIPLDYGTLFRTMPVDIPESDWHKHEDCSAWSDEKRAEVVARVAVERAAAKLAYDKWVAGIRALQESARAKLSDEEYEAMQMEEWRL